MKRFGFFFVNLLSNDTLILLLPQPRTALAGRCDPLARTAIRNTSII